MRKLAVMVGAAALGIGLQSAAHAYTTSAAVTFTFGGSANGASADQEFAPTTGGISVGGIQPDNSTLIHTLSGANFTNTYNSNFVPDTAACARGAGIVPLSAGVSAARKYGCRWGSSGLDMFTKNAVIDGGPLGQASGTVSVTDTTMTGTLTIVNTSDEPTGATTTLVDGATPVGGYGIVAGTTRVSNSVGNGFAGYNYRTADGSPLGNGWYGVTNAGTYTLHLSGTFNSTTWTVTGGYATFTDPGFACQQGGIGGFDGDFRGYICSSSVGAPAFFFNGFNPDGSHLSWGMDPDGSATGGTTSAITMRDSTGTTELATLSGVVAGMSIAVNGSITTSYGEHRRAFGYAGSCVDHIRFDTTINQLTCGSITAGNLVITGQINDSDFDGLLDPQDNCINLANNTGVAAQCDSDGDGYGNRCDGDMNNNNATNSQDYGLFRQRLGLPSVAPVYDKGDINCNQAVNSQDYGLFRGLLGALPGPSGAH